MPWALLGLPRRVGCGGQGCSGALAGCGEELPAGKAMSCLCEQGSQPSTASPFKQDVFVYSASPGSESPGVGATPVIMSRSPTGG